MLGLIPRVSSKAPHEHAITDPVGEYAEAYRRVRAAIIQTCAAQFRPLTLAVASSLPNEGKTTFCIALARLLAAQHRVLLVDCDLRHPSIGRLLGNDGRGDVVAFLRGEKQVAEIAQTDGKSDLHYITAGFGTDDPSAVFSSRSLAMVKSAAANYDVVIFDTPPIVPVADGGIIASCSDCCVFLIRWARTPRPVVLNALTQLMRTTATISGTVMTHVDIRKLANYNDGSLGYYYAHHRKYLHSGQQRKQG